MNRRDFLKTGTVLAAASALPLRAQTAAPLPDDPATPFAPDLDNLRRLARLPAGPLPVALNAVKVADSIRPRRVVIEGGDDTPHIMCRALYQLVYDDGALMIDTGMDEETHRQFGVAGRPFTDPFYADRYRDVLRALDEASGIFITHYHADHIGGLVRSPSRASLLRKTWLSRATAGLMLRQAHKPAVAVSAADLAAAIVFDYDHAFPLAPGLVAIRAPGHSPDHQMVYARLASGREFLLSIDSAWHLDNIRRLRLKAAPWVKEDRPRLLEHYRWLKHLDETEPNVTVLVTHDNDQLAALTASGVLGGSLHFHTT